MQTCFPQGSEEFSDDDTDQVIEVAFAVKLRGKSAKDRRRMPDEENPEQAVLVDNYEMEGRTYRPSNSKVNGTALASAPHQLIQLGQNKGTR